MSIRSYCYYEATWPKETPIDEGWLYKDEPEDLGESLRVERELYDLYEERVLEDLVKMFGKPLDEVSGLELHCEYTCYDDGYYEGRLDIVDGHVTYKEAKRVFVERPIRECLIDIGR